MNLYLYNTLTKHKDKFIPVDDNLVGLYTCGPTVYNYAHIGNLRTYVFEDILKRVLEYNNYEVKHVMNITDVGHLTGDRDMGEDKIEKEAQQKKKTAWDIAEFYTQAFKDNLRDLNIEFPKVWAKATDYITQQIDMIQELEKLGYTYTTSDGVYYDTSKFPEYNKLNHKNLEELQEGARVEVNPEKRNSTDFALWKFSPQGQTRQMEWNSPWGVGFPGWHIECSAISLYHLENNLDIHCGGIDHIDTHHTNEIAQVEACTDKKFFNYWMHGAFLEISGGEKMAKSGGNFLTLHNTYTEADLDPLAFRFLCLQAHYRKPLEFNKEIAQNNAQALASFQEKVRELGQEKGEINSEYIEEFQEYINNDLDTPQALALAQKLLKSSLSNPDKLATLLEFDKVLGLNLENLINSEIPQDIKDLADKRQTARENKDYDQADKLREEIESKGYRVKDDPEGTKIRKK